MEHEFVPGKRRCLRCGLKERYVAHDARGPGCYGEGEDADGLYQPTPAPDAPCPRCGEFCGVTAPEPEKPPQTWHLNVWTDTGVAKFAGSKAITQKDADALSWRFRLMEEGKGPADMPLDGVETALVNSLIQLISEIRANKPEEAE